MAIITRSNKLAIQNLDDQTKMVSEGYVLLRIIHEADSYTIMTATAREDDGDFVAYPDLEKLISAAEGAFPNGERRTDNWGRPYLVAGGIDHPSTIRHIANEIAGTLNLPAVDAPWADEEMREIYDEFSVTDDDEPAYLSDGVHISSRGRLKD